MLVVALNLDLSIFTCHYLIETTYLCPVWGLDKILTYRAYNCEHLLNYILKILPHVVFYVLYKPWIFHIVKMIKKRLKKMVNDLFEGSKGRIIHFDTISYEPNREINIKKKTI